MNEVEEFPMDETEEILFIFNRILGDRYEGFDLDSYLFRLEEIISSNNSNVSFTNQVIDNAVNIAKRDFEFYVRIMNWTIKNSAICLSYLFMKSSLQLIKKEYGGKLITLLNNNGNSIWVQLYYNCIWIIVHNELIGEIDISISNSLSTGNIFIGKDSKSIVPVSYLGKEIIQILDLLRTKYIHALIYSEQELNENDLSISISKLNNVYQYYAEYNVCDISKMVYSQDNVELYLLENNLKPDCYDELFFEKFGYLFFPLLTDIIVKDGKISIFNEGYGSLANCKFYINYNDKLIFNKEIEIKNNDTFDIFIEDCLEKEILTINSNDKIDFCFLFYKFNRSYRFCISKEVWKVKEGLLKKENGNMNINTINNNGIMAIGDHASVSNSMATNNTYLNNGQMQELINELTTIIENVGNLDVESNEKIQIKSKVEQALDETKKINSDISLIRSFIQESGILIKNVSNIPVLLGAVTSIKTLLGI